MAGLDPATQPDAQPGAMAGYLYFMANKRYGTLYVGVTSDIARRIWEHREGLLPGFTKRHGLKLLVYYEVYDRIEEAIQREQNIKHWKRLWKTQLVDGLNPNWDDLYHTLI